MWNFDTRAGWDELICREDAPSHGKERHDPVIWEKIIPNG